MTQQLEITDVIGTPCLNISHGALVALLEEKILGTEELLTVDFTNVHISAARKVEPAFYEITEQYDYFVPDSQVLKWAVNLRGGSMKERVYGPDFLKYAILNSSIESTHYFLGASQDCLDRLLGNVRELRPDLKIVGASNGYFKLDEESQIIGDINDSNPDFIWVGLGTPKQQEWIARSRPVINRGVLLAVGFAFDVNAGTKKDAPQWIQQIGMTWFYRLCSEPRRLWWRYLKYNSIFIYYLFKQLIVSNK